MAAHLGRVENTKLGMEMSGGAIDVPQDCIARLMYYLNCVSKTLGDAVPSEFTNYEKYYILNNDMKKLVIRLADKLPPNKIPTFIEVPRIPDSSGSAFLSITSVEETVSAMGIQVNGAAMMALKRSISEKQTVLQIMAYTPLWARLNYHEPLKQAKSVCTIL